LRDSSKNELATGVSFENYFKLTLNSITQDGKITKTDLSADEKFMYLNNSKLATTLPI
jgi:hypothetical protein